MAFAIDSISAGPYYAGDTITLTVSDASATGKTASIPAGVLSVTAQTATTIEFTCPDPKTFGTSTTSYSSDVTITAVDGAESDTIAFQVSPDVGHYHSIVLSTGGYDAIPVTGVAIGDSAYGYWFSGTGSQDLSVGALSSTGGGVFRLWIQDVSDSNTWGTSGDITIASASGITSVNGGSDITDCQEGVVIQMSDAITAASAIVTIDGDRQSNIALDNVLDQVIFDHRLADMRINPTGDTAHLLNVEFTDEIVEIVIAYGQSNTFGWKTADLNPNDTVSESATDILMMNSAKTALVAATGQIPSDETASLDAGDSDCMIDFANYYRAFMNARGTTDIEQALLVSGKGASSAASLAFGTTPFTNMATDFTTLCGLITAAGKVPHVSTILYTQGEKDVNSSTESGWSTRVADDIYDPLVSHIKSTTGQTDDPIMQLTVLTMHSNYTLNGQDYNQIALEQLALEQLRPNKIFVTVHSGHFTHSADGIHYAGDGQRYMRQMQAKFAAYPSLRSLKAKYATRNSAVIELYLQGGTGNLQFDYAFHASTTAKGLIVLNNVAANVTISSVVIDNVNKKLDVTLADGGTNGPYTISGSYFSDNELGGGQYHANIVPVYDSDTRDGALSDSASIGNQSLKNPLMPFNLTVGEL